MTALGQRLAEWAARVLPAADAAAEALTSRRGTLAEHVTVAHQLHGCMGVLAGAVSITGYQAKGRWAWEFCDGRAMNPADLYQTTNVAAQMIQDGANVTIAVRAALIPDPRRGRHPASPAVGSLWKVLLAYDEVLREGIRGRSTGDVAQVPEYARIFTELAAACRPLALAVKLAGPRVRQAEVSWDSVWAEGFGGDLPGCYKTAAASVHHAGAMLGPLGLRAEQDATWWRSRSRPRPARR